ncbi:bifunctional riboflavin kinase/FAD synthetase [Arthrobacter alpinus]|uniref:Riboflavin biosynthesis protein n=1 Tax=Arthrobacter alpinus TaxID=656366 RepID=A0A0S2M1R4_9MICC|nr:bifunctional riboflavin kinase/FAD synthetase [Arthrobacter alpinus]ALO67582.1 bifunctional riboflavin kinase/FMN adenylyltransferase [Arthrobacter alpinus]MDD0857406.1 bifunctional riboflavin kinase/FAD synthetase [Arthrobacter alpinus]
MQIWNSLDEVPQDFGPCVVTLGNFDGLHRGHQEVLAQVRAEAQARGAKSVALTFDPHPALIHRPDTAPAQIMGLADKLAAMAALGLDGVLVLPYTLEFAQQTPEEFVRRVFVDGLRSCAVVVGHDVRFGKGNTGDLTTMVSLGAELGFDVVVVNDEGHDRRWSSTWVREALHKGAVDTAAQVLGRAHTMSGEVVHGAARGRELGFPTANLSPDACGIIPSDGVYAGWLTDTHGHRWPAAISVGSNPTFVGVSRQVEAYVIDRPEEPVEAFNLYGQHVVVEFVQRLRGMVAYTGPEALIEQMHQDVVDTRTILG